MGTYGNGGAIYCNDYGSPTVTNCTFSSNSANRHGGAIYCNYDSSPILNNCILWGNSAGSGGDEIYIYDAPSYPSYATLKYCCVDNTGYGGKTSNITEDSCIHSDPQFVDAANGDYHLQDTSPCIDAGNNSYVPGGVTTDLDGAGRIVGSAVDIGAYERQGPDLVITSCMLPDAREGDAYTYALNAYGGSPPYNWSATGLPAGLSLDASGTISGTPVLGTRNGQPYTVSVTVSDSGGKQVAKVFRLYVLPRRSGVTTWYVDAQNGSDANEGTSWVQALRTIWWALRGAEDGDTILLADGTYYEHGLDFCGKQVHLMSQNGAANCVIDCQKEGRAFCFRSGEGQNTVVEGVTVKNGQALYGGAIYCTSSSPTITNCSFSGNDAGCYGGAIFCLSCSPVVSNCTFSGNSATWCGGAIYCASSSSPIVTNCTFSGNSASDGGGAICCSSSSPTLNNCILWGNTASSSGNEIYIYDLGSSCTLNYSCVDNTGYGGYAGNIDDSNNCIHSVPQFVDAANGDYHLQPTSPCIDAGDNSLVPSGVTTDLDGNQRIVDGDNDGVATVDIGAYEYQSSVQPLHITTTSLPDATEGVSYSATIEATGGTTPYTWIVTGLPLGLTWTQVGDAVEITGTPAFGAAGTYSVDVTVTDSSSPAQSDNVTLQLVVNSGGGGTTLKADFEASPTYGKAPLTVTFTDKSTGNPTSWEWDFDNDGTVDSYDQNPQWTYNDPGWYTVKLTVSNGTNTDTCVKEKFIQVASGIYYVDGVNGDDGNGGTGWGDAWKTIGKALSVAGDYDLVLVADATYNEVNLNFNGKKIYLKGVDHNTTGAQPVIVCQGSGRAFYFASGETKDSTIDNFAIWGGNNQGGGAICCRNSSSPTVVNCAFSGNSATWYGGAIYCDSSSPSVINCMFAGNSASRYGGAIACYNYSSPTVTDCVFSGNGASDDGGAIYCYNHSNATVTNCTFSGNSADYGGAIFCSSSSSATLNNCTFSGNSASNFFGGAIACYSNSSVTLNNCILWGDSAGSSGNEIYIEDSGSSCTLNHCCVDNTGYGGQTGNIDDSNNCIFVDPQFMDAANGDYHLQPTSPCIDAGDNSYVPAGVMTDLNGNPRIVNGIVDIGAYEKQ